MEKIYQSDIAESFILNNELYPLTEYTVTKEGDNIFIKHREVERSLLHKQPFTEICKKDNSTFETVDECYNYLKDAIEDINGETEEDTAIRTEVRLYTKRIKDGRKLSKNLMSELRLNSKKNQLPREVNAYIETKLDKVKLNIDRGWWVTALEELESTTVELYFTQDLYDRIHLTISTYISENYN